MDRHCRRAWQGADYPSRTAGTSPVSYTHLDVYKRQGQVADGKGREGGQAMNAAGYQTLIVKVSKPIAELDGIFDDAEAWGVETLKGWVEDYVCLLYTSCLFVNLPVFILRL